MAEWILVPCLATLRSGFNLIAPGRDKASDGSIGDTAHQDSTSDHNPDETGRVPVTDADKTNEVHAIDVDADLRTSGLTMEKVVQFLLARCRSGAEKRLRYIIFNRRIWSASSDWVQKSYTGPNPHIEHAHFSASYDTAREASTASWHLEELMPITEAEIDKIAERVEQRVWNHTEPDPRTGGTTTRRVGGEMRMMEYREEGRDVNLHTKLDAILGAVAGVDESVVQALVGGSDQQTADVLTRLLGDRRDAIAAIWAGDAA